MLLVLQTVVAELTSKFGEAALVGKGDWIKSVLVEEVQKRQGGEAAPPAPSSPAPAPKKRAKAAETEKPKTSKKKKQDEEEHEKTNKVHELPTNVEAEVDLSSFLRRNPGRTGRVVTKDKPKKKEKKARDPSKPKRPGAPMILSSQMSEFMGTKISTRTEVTTKVRAWIKEKNLQVIVVCCSFLPCLNAKSKKKKKRIPRMEEICCFTMIPRWPSCGRRTRRFRFFLFFFFFAYFDFFPLHQNKDNLVQVGAADFETLV
jgi:pyruvate/2-oxoglutarate dehydrogenase complex dihydrolipoamide acyltransferase (E2) component